MEFSLNVTVDDDTDQTSVALDIQAGANAAFEYLRIKGRKLIVDETVDFGKIGVTQNVSLTRLA